MRKTGVAIIGLGAATRNIHIPALKMLPNVEIVGGYDSAVAAAEGVSRYDSVDALLSQRKPDIVIIATPPASHVELTRLSLAAGCHVFCEKPLANDVAAAETLVPLARAANRHVVVNSEFPFMAIHAEAKRAMTPERFGRLLFMEVRQSFVVTEATEQGWRGDEVQRSFKEFGTHVIDLAKHFFDERPAWIRAQMPKPFERSGPDYLNIVDLGFSGDRVAHVVLNRHARGTHRYLDIALSGERATIETSIGGRLQLSGGIRASTRRPFVELDMAMGGRARLYRGNRFETIAKSPLGLFAEGTARLLQAYIDAIAAGTTPPNALDEALDTVRLLYTAYEQGGRSDPDSDG